MLARAGQKEVWYAGFPERRLTEVPGITLPRTRVNKGEKIGRRTQPRTLTPSRHTGEQPHATTSTPGCRPSHRAMDPTECPSKRATTLWRSRSTRMLPGASPLLRAKSSRPKTCTSSESARKDARMRLRRYTRPRQVGQRTSVVAMDRARDLAAHRTASLRASCNTAVGQQVSVKLEGIHARSVGNCEAAVVGVLIGHESSPCRACKRLYGRLTKRVGERSLERRLFVHFLH
jgi:hypothetical protein